MEDAVANSQGFDASLRESARVALQNAAQDDPLSQVDAGCDWCGGVLLAWTSPPEVREVKPEVQKHFRRPIEPGDLLASVDGTDVCGMQREDILELMAKFKGSLSFDSVDAFQKALRESARQALQSGPQGHPLSQAGQGCDWCGGVLIEWTSPPEVRDVKPEVQQHFPSPVKPGDQLSSVDDRDVRDMRREEILELMANFKGSVGFAAGDAFGITLRESARKALKNAAQDDRLSQVDAGCDWCGGVLLAWTSPPEVREVKPEVQKHFRRPIEPGDRLASVDGTDVCGMQREEILELMAKFKGSLSFKSVNAFQKALRESARQALQSGPQGHPSSQAGQGCDWCGGVLIEWTSPPEVRDVKPEVQQHFPSPVKPGDRLSSVDDRDVRDMRREEILELMANFKGSVGFAAGDAFGITLRESARKALKNAPQDDPLSQVDAGCDWCGGVLLAWTSSPEVREVKPEVQKRFPHPIEPGDLLASVDGTDVRGMQREDILELMAKFKGSLSFDSVDAFQKALRESARQALQSGPQGHPSSQAGQGCDWCGGVLIEWTSPPEVRDVKPEVQQHFPSPVKPGDRLSSVDDRDVRDMRREEILELMANFKGSVGFAAGDAFGITLRESARKALKNAPQDDPLSQVDAGCDWCGGVLLAWTSPPEVREVKAEVQKRFPHPIEPGDRLASVDGTDVRGMQREDILELMAKFKGSLSFRSRDRLSLVQESAIEALERGPEADPLCSRGCNWIDGILSLGQRLC